MIENPPLSIPLRPSQEQFLAAITKTERLFPAPRTLGRALQLLHDPQSDVNDIAGLISCDSALAADVLRCANSAFYGFGTRISGIDLAVQKIGFRETIRLLNIVVAHQAAGRDLGSYGIAAEDFWAESLYCGLLLEQLVRHAGAPEVDEAYTAGLLRFIGRLAINQTIHDFGCGLFWNGASTVAEWELENVGLTQEKAGALLLRHWQFADVVVLAVEGQDDAAAASSPYPLVQAMHLLGQILPAGKGMNHYLELADHPPAVPADHPFVVQHDLTAEHLAPLFAEAQRAFVAVRTELYR